MALETLYITGGAGLTEVMHPKLAYCEVMHCKREGKMIVETSDTPTGKRFKHHPTAAKIELPADLPIGSGGIDPSGTIDAETENFIILIKY